jgi:hypothetical protein
LRLRAESDDETLRSFENYMSRPRTLGELRVAYHRNDLTSTEFEVAVERVLAVEPEEFPD